MTGSVPGDAIARRASSNRAIDHMWEAVEDCDMSYNRAPTVVARLGKKSGGWRGGRYMGRCIPRRYCVVQRWTKGSSSPSLISGS